LGLPKGADHLRGIAAQEGGEEKLVYFYAYTLQEYFLHITTPVAILLHLGSAILATVRITKGTGNAEIGAAT